MENLVCRVLTIRNFKDVVFLDVSCGTQGIKEIKAEKSKFDLSGISKGDILNVSCEKTTGRAGKPLYNLTGIIYHQKATTPFDGAGLVGMKNSECARLAGSVNGRGLINVYQLKREFIDELSQILAVDNFKEAQCGTLEKEMPSGGFMPIMCKTLDASQTSLRTTFENYLKQLCAILLDSFYAIGPVFYNVIPAAKVDREIDILEFVSPYHDMRYLETFIRKIDALMQELMQKYELDDKDDKSIKLPPLEVIDFSETDGNLDVVNKKYQNTIIRNFPVDSPYIKHVDGIGKVETRWYVRGRFVGHGYVDETNYEIIRKALNEQQAESSQVGTFNEMTYFEWGMPQTISFGLGIDMLLQLYLNLPKIQCVTNPLGLNAKLPERKGKGQTLARKQKETKNG